MLPCCHACWQRMELEQRKLMMGLWELSLWIRPSLIPPLRESSQAQTPCRVSRPGGSASPQQTGGFRCPREHWIPAWGDHSPRHGPDGTVGCAVLRASLAHSHMLLAGKSQLCLPATVEITWVRGSLQECSLLVLAGPLGWNPRWLASPLKVSCTNMGDQNGLQNTVVQKREWLSLGEPRSDKQNHSSDPKTHD